MAIWRSTELETLLGGPLDETGLTAASLQRLVEQEFAKDVTALANHAGGLLLIGVDEQDGAASEAVPSVSDPDRDSQRLRQALVNHAQPVPRTAFVPIPAVGGHQLAVIIPPSPLAPHAVTGGRGDDRRPLHWYVRDGAHVRALAESEVAERYRARFRGADDRAARRSRAAAEGREALGRAPTAFGSTPQPSPKPPSPRRSTLKQSATPSSGGGPSTGLPRRADGSSTPMGRRSPGQGGPPSPAAPGASATTRPTRQTPGTATSSSMPTAARSPPPQSSSTLATARASALSPSSTT